MQCYVTSVVSNALPSYGPKPTRLLCPWDCPGKNTGGGCHALLEGIFLTQGWNSRLIRSPALAAQFFTTSAAWDQVSRSVVSHSLRPHESQHTRPPCPSLSPRVCSNSCPLNQWCHPNTSSSVTLFYSCLQSFPASGSFPMSWLFTSYGQSTGTSASASVLPMNSQGWFPLRLTGWSPCSPRNSQESSPAP